MAGGLHLMMLRNDLSNDDLEMDVRCGETFRTNMNVTELDGTPIQMHYDGNYRISINF